MNVLGGDKFKKIIPNTPFPLPCTPMHSIQKSTAAASLHAAARPPTGPIVPPVAEWASTTPPPPSVTPAMVSGLVAPAGPEALPPAAGAISLRIGLPPCSGSCPVVGHHPPPNVFFNLGFIWNLILLLI
jgi:hypothetical protein